MKNGIKIGVPEGLDIEEVSDILLKALTIKDNTPAAPAFDDKKIEKIAKEALEGYSKIYNSMLSEIFEVLKDEDN